MLHHRNGKRTQRECRRVVASMLDSSMAMADCRSAVLIASASTQKENLLAPREQVVHWRNRALAPAPVREEGQLWLHPLASQRRRAEARVERGHRRRGCRDVCA